MSRYIITSTVQIEVNDAGEVSVISKETKMEEVRMKESTIACRHQLNVSEKKYGILTFGKKNPIGSVLPLDSDIKVIYEGQIYEGHSHKTTQGRIDRLTSLIYENFCENDWIQVEYNEVSKELKIVKTDR